MSQPFSLNLTPLYPSVYPCSPPNLTFQWQHKLFAVSFYFLGAFFHLPLQLSPNLIPFRRSRNLFGGVNRGKIGSKLSRARSTYLEPKNFVSSHFTSSFPPLKAKRKAIAYNLRSLLPKLQQAISEALQQILAHSQVLVFQIG